MSKYIFLTLSAGVLFIWGGLCLKLSLIHFSHNLFLKRLNLLVMCVSVLVGIIQPDLNAYRVSIAPFFIVWDVSLSLNLTTLLIEIKEFWRGKLEIDVEKIRANNEHAVVLRRVSLVSSLNKWNSYCLVGCYWVANMFIRFCYLFLSGSARLYHVCGLIVLSSLHNWQRFVIRVSCVQLGLKIAFIYIA